MKKGPNVVPQDLEIICWDAEDRPQNEVEGAIEWLQRFVGDLYFKNPEAEDDIVLAERGLPESMPRRRWHRQRDLDNSCGWMKIKDLMIV